MTSDSPAHDAQTLAYEVAQDRVHPDAWRVEHIDYERDGAVETTIFLGPQAEERAKEYATFKSRPSSARTDAPESDDPNARHFRLLHPPGLHDNTYRLVVQFANALARKLRRAEEKYGYGDGWRDPSWMDECRTKLVEHIAKGDPLDVAAYCAFLFHHGESTAVSATPDAPYPKAEGNDALGGWTIKPSFLDDVRNRAVVGEDECAPSWETTEGIILAYLALRPAPGGGVPEESPHG